MSIHWPPKPLRQKLVVDAAYKVECKWPVRRSKSGHRACCAPTFGLVYCPEHYALAHTSEHIKHRNIKPALEANILRIKPGAELPELPDLVEALGEGE